MAHFYKQKLGGSVQRINCLFSGKTMRYLYEILFENNVLDILANAIGPMDYAKSSTA